MHDFFNPPFSGFGKWGGKGNAIENAKDALRIS